MVNLEGESRGKGGRVGSDGAAAADGAGGSRAAGKAVVTAVGSEKVMQEGKKANRSKRVNRPKGTLEGIASSPVPAGLHGSDCNRGQVGFFVHSSPGNLHSGSVPNNLMCNQDCGWCGQYMSHLADE